MRLVQIRRPPADLSLNDLRGQLSIIQGLSAAPDRVVYFATNGSDQRSYRGAYTMNKGRLRALKRPRHARHRTPSPRYSSRHGHSFCRTNRI